MWQMSDRAGLELGRSHTAVSRVDVWQGGRPVASLNVDGGVVRVLAGRAVLRNLSATLIDPTGALTGGNEDDLLNPYDCELAVWRGVQWATVTTAAVFTPNEGFGVQPFGTGGFGGVDATLVSRRTLTAELAPLGVFGLTGRQVNGDGTVSVAGLDRAMRYQGPMTGPLAVGAGTPVEQAIEALLSTRNPGVTFAQSYVTGFTVGPLLFEADIDVWREAQSLAQSVGGWLYHDRLGGLVFASLLPTNSRPVARYAAGGGLLLSAERSEDSDTIRNVVVVESAKAGAGGIIRAVAEDTDPTSPTYARGRYGRRPKTIKSQHLGSLEQAQQMAATELVRELGRSETASITCVVDPRRDPLDVLTVHDPDAGLTDRGMVVETVDIPLDVQGEMRIGLHKSLLAQDGRVLDVPLELAA